MAKIDIPEQYRQGLIGLLNLKDGDMDLLLRAIKEVAPSPEFNELKAQLISKTNDIKGNDEIIDSLLSMYGARAGCELSLVDFVEGITRAVRESDEFFSKLEHQDSGYIKDTLTRLLDIDTINDSIKAVQLLTDHPNTLTNARIYTDIRPVFKKDTTEALACALVVHTLKLSFLQGDHEEEFFVAMDDRDLDILLRVIERAKDKGRFVNSLLKSADIAHLEPKKGT